MRRNPRWPSTGLLCPAWLFGLGLLLCACSSIGSLAGQGKIRHPQVELTGVRLSGLSFDRANLQFGLRIKNPNPLGLKLSGFRYHLAINDHPFLQGTEEKEVIIAAQGESSIPIPLTLSFDHLYQVFENLRREDEASFLLTCAVLFDLPVLGSLEIPVSTGGDFPLPKIPAIALQGIRVTGLSPLRVDLALDIRVDNPNAFSMILEGMQYQLVINGQPWASGETGQRIPLSELQEGFVEIPFSLDILRIGASLEELLAENKPLDYRFQGDLDLNTSLPLLGRVHLPFDLTGRTEVTRSLK